MAAVLCAPTRNRATHPTLVVRRNVATAGPYLRRQPAAAKRDSWVRLWLHVCGRTCTASSDATSCAAHGIAASDRERGALRLSLPVAKRVIVRRLADTVPCSKRKAGSTLRSSRAVPHPSTNRALRRLEVGRDPVHSTRCGRQRPRWELAPGLHVRRSAREGARQTSRPLSVGWGCGCACGQRPGTPGAPASAAVARE